ncbi:MAG TPA: hypothetical protein ENJ95_08875 [Bacteroidetes bacterium]|nr:hypothetical protein [Bacteroidota bacterium]
MIFIKKSIYAILFILPIISCKKENKKPEPSNQTASIKEESLKTLYLLADALIALQIKEKSDPGFGAIYCKDCHEEKIYHTRAAEAVFPFAVAYKHSGDRTYLQAAIYLGNWLIKQQLPDGAWKETPEEWTGTTADQLLMMAAAFPIINNYLSETEKQNWKLSIKKAADYLTEVMRPEFASINYCATTCSSLTLANNVVPDTAYLKKAKILAGQVTEKMDADGFITGEGGRLNGIKHGVDIGYDIDMSLWGLGLYAQLTKDEFINNKVKAALLSHIYFVYPNGSIDGSWGIRSNKWTTYGSATADGCQILFSLYADEDARYRTAAIKNLKYMRGMIRNGLVGYGPQYWEIYNSPPCIYPTFARAENLALAIEFGGQEKGILPPIPTDIKGWVKYFPTLDVVQARSDNFMATITAYNYKDPKRKSKSKYMHRPAGGAMCNLWVEGHGFLQTSSQTKYSRWEPMHFPEAPGIKCLTPRIEYTDSSGYYTNLYEFDTDISVSDAAVFPKNINASGELKNEEHITSGISYTLSHIIDNKYVQKTVAINFTPDAGFIKIIEPIVEQKGMRFKLQDERTVLIEGGKRAFKLEIREGSAKIELGKDAADYWSPFPSLKCYPIVIILNKNEMEERVSYRISVLD